MKCILGSIRGLKSHWLLTTFYLAASFALNPSRRTLWDENDIKSLEAPVSAKTQMGSTFVSTLLDVTDQCQSADPVSYCTNILM